jgi:hypothetical protein
MPLAEETKKRIWQIIIIAVLVCGALFMVFAFFLNKGTLIISAKAPYLIDIQGIKTVTCNQDDCPVVVAPGDYSVTVQKEGYRQVDLKVSVPIAGEAKREVTFQIVPKITLLGDEKTLNIFPAPVVDTKDLPQTPLFYDNNYVLYIERDAQTHRQTLYVRGIEDGKVGEKTVVTSFIRDPQNYRIISSIEKNNKIALIDNAADGSTLYMIDLKEKSRTALLTFPLISDLKWLPGTDDFIFEGREEGDLATSIYVYSQGKTQKLELETPLKDVIPVSKDRLVAATIQQASGNTDLSQMEGGIVVLGENEATPSVAPLFSVQPAPVVKFIDYSLTANQGRLLKVVQDLNLPQNGKLSETGKSAYFLIDGKDYELLFSD